MLLLVSSVKLVAEIALMAMLGQWLLGLLAGAKRDSNLFYRLLAVLTGPFIKGARLITPRVVLDRHVPLVAFILLAWVWLGSVVAKGYVCQQMGLTVEACART